MQRNTSLKNGKNGDRSHTNIDYHDGLR